MARAARTGACQRMATMANRQERPRLELSELLHGEGSRDQLETLLDQLEPGDLLHAIFTLKSDEQRTLLAMLAPDHAAELVAELPNSHVAGLIEAMPVEEAAPIVNELASDLRVDILSELDQEDAEAIIAHLDEEEALEVRELISYPPDLAGGLMMTEFASYPMAMTVREVVDDLTGDFYFLEMK